MPARLIFSMQREIDRGDIVVATSRERRHWGHQNLSGKDEPGRELDIFSCG